jgi:5-methylcytosine-specific restriction endonuclease McrA
MAQIWAKKFYESRTWQQVRDSVYSEQHGICQRCNNKNGAGEIVHHKIHLNRKNINDVNITLNKNNLELLCRVCHALEHEGVSATSQWLLFNEQGELISYEDKSIYK